LIPTNFNCDELLVINSWNNPGSAENVFTRAIQTGFAQGQSYRSAFPCSARRDATFRVKAPLLAQGQTLCLLGEGAALGNWNTSQPVLLNRISGEDYLSVQVDCTTSLSARLQIRRLRCRKEFFRSLRRHANRILNDEITSDKFMSSTTALLHARKQWRGAGVAIPVFSLRSENSFGVGEFLDLKPFADGANRRD